MGESRMREDWDRGLKKGEDAREKRKRTREPRGVGRGWGCRCRKRLRGEVEGGNAAGVMEGSPQRER